MNIKVNLDAGTLEVGDVQIAVSNKVRRLADSNRRVDEVVRTIPGGRPYDPQQFPRGTWNVTGVEWQEDKKFDMFTYGPVKIRTDAKQFVTVWDLDADGDYRNPTAALEEDTGYLLHYSTSKTTLGCIRIDRASDAVMLAKLIERTMDTEDVVVEVI